MAAGDKVGLLNKQDAPDAAVILQPQPFRPVNIP
jgi:hypothetical protein